MHCCAAAATAAAAAAATAAAAAAAAGPLPPARCGLLSAHPSARATTQPTYVLACFFFVFFFIREIVNLCEHSKKSWNIGDNGMTNIVVGMILQSKF